MNSSRTVCLGVLTESAFFALAHAIRHVNHSPSARVSSMHRRWRASWPRGLRFISSPSSTPSTTKPPTPPPVSLHRSYLVQEDSSAILYIRLSDQQGPRGAEKDRTRRGGKRKRARSDHDRQSSTSTRTDTVTDYEAAPAAAEGAAAIVLPRDTRDYLFISSLSTHHSRHSSSTSPLHHHQRVSLFIYGSLVFRLPRRSSRADVASDACSPLEMTLRPARFGPSCDQPTTTLLAPALRSKQLGREACPARWRRGRGNEGRPTQITYIITTCTFASKQQRSLLAVARQQRVYSPFLVPAIQLARQPFALPHFRVRIYLRRKFSFGVFHLPMGKIREINYQRNP